MIVKCDVVGASITESTWEGKVFRKLHCYVITDHANTIANRGQATLDLIVKEAEIQAMKDKVFDAVGTTCNVIYDKAGSNYKLYDVQTI